MYTILRGGYNSKHPKGYEKVNTDGLLCYLLLIIRSPAFIQIGEEKFKVNGNSAVIIRPQVPYRYSGEQMEYRNDWLYFESSEKNFEDEYGQLLNHPIPLVNVLLYSQYIKNIVWEKNYALEKYRDRNVSMLLEIILNKLVQENQDCNTNRSYNPYASKLQEVRLTMLSRPDQEYTPIQLASALNVSPSYFQVLYKNFFGVPFKSDLIQMRVNYAKNLIFETNFTLEQIAQMSGYNSEIHFYRQFKAKTGMTPKEYRISMASEIRKINEPVSFGADCHHML